MEWVLYIDEEGEAAHDATFLESSVVLGMGALSLVLVLDLCSLIELAWEWVGRQTGLAEEVAEYLKESVQVVLRLTISLGPLFFYVTLTIVCFPLGLCQYLEDQYIFSLGLQTFSLAPFPQDAPTPVPLLLFIS